MKITHIYHSGFVIELECTVLIFDWYSGDLPYFDPGKKIFVFVTHRHADHYSPEIWSLMDKYENIYYVLECCTAPEQKGDHILHVQPGRHYKLRGVLIYAIRSNDKGVAYVVSAEGKNFFHAGDLNIWHWKDASDNKNDYSRRVFKNQLEKISGWDFDAAMLPLDPRLEDNAPNAIVEFMRVAKCRNLFPMHYWNRKDEAFVYLEDERLDPYREKICCLNEKVI